MADSNYLPFAMRENIVIPVGESRALSIISSSFLGQFKGALVEYQDVSITTPTIVSDNSLNGGLVRYGFEGRGYLMEEPVNPFLIGYGPSSERRYGWRFARPYTLNPGQCLRVDYEFAAPSTGIFGAVFYGQRLDNGESIFLAGSNILATAASSTGVLTGDFFTCPADTPIKIHGVSLSAENTLETDTTVAFGAQIYDANGRELLTLKKAPNGTVTDLTMRQDWVNIVVAVTLPLGKSNGWELPLENFFIFEIENNNTTDSLEYLITVRGSVEVKS